MYSNVSLEKKSMQIFMYAYIIRAKLIVMRVMYKYSTTILVNFILNKKKKDS